MRPLPGADAWPSRCQRPAAHRDTTPLMTSTMSTSNSQMSFVFADESSIDSYIEHSSTRPRFRDPRKTSFEFGNNTSSAHEDDTDEEEDDDEPSRPTTMQSESDYATAYSPIPLDSAFSRSPASMISHQQTMSRPITPMMLGTSVTGSAISSPSRAYSFTGSISEHAISSDEEDHHERSSEGGSAPQFIMPSIKMPSRRPFTATGKGMGRLKVLIAGDSGVGKTSLIKSIVQTCEHIVHVDPIGPMNQPNTRSSRSRKSPGATRTGYDSKSQISEIFASTKPFPDWWSELDEFSISQRRKSLGDNILERNICFVDTPGFGNSSSAMETIVPCVEYVESHLDRVLSDTLSEPDMLNMLGGNGGFQVDAVLYLISSRLKPADLEYMRRLVRLTNVIPLISQADKLPLEQMAMLKEQIAGQLRDAHIPVFNFAPLPNHKSDGTPITAPYAVSNAMGSDHDIMDASLLMSPDYVQPLMSTELTYLVENIFSPDGTSWLRHAAAKKYLQWRNVSPSRPRHLYRPLSPPGPELTTTSGALIERPSLALMRTYDHGPVDSSLHFQIADWAADLQRSLASERARLDALAHGERAVWLTEKFDGCVHDGTLVAVHELNNRGCSRKSRGLKQGLSRKTQHHQDPLGLLQVVADLKTRGWIALELFGSISVLGGLAFWISRHQWRFEPVVLADEWARVWGMDI